MPANYPHFWAMVRRLRREFPCGAPVRVRVVKALPKKVGACWGTTGRYYVDHEHRPTYFLIRIVDTGDEDLMVHWLGHEWAHATAWSFHAHSTEEHPPEWGVAYSAIYRTLFES